MQQHVPAPDSTSHDVNFYRFYHALFDTDTPDITLYHPLDTWQEVATRLLQARSEKGVLGVRRALAQLGKEDAGLFRRLTALVSGDIARIDEPVGKLLSEYISKEIAWLWKGRLALGKITLLDGLPGEGKSMISVDIGARITRGHVMPDNTPCLAQGGVILITPEDGIEDTIKPRFERAGADTTKVLDLSMTTETLPSGLVMERPFDINLDLERLEKGIQRIQAKLIIIDPVMAIMGNRETYKAPDVYAAFMPIKALAEKYQCAVLLLRHFTKATNGSVITRGQGSISFMGIARLAMFVTVDPGDETRYILAAQKSNISKKGPALNLIYTVENDEQHGDERPYVVWHGASSHTIQELTETPIAERTGVNRQELLDILKEAAPEALKLQQIIDEMPGVNPANIKMTLKRMLDDCQIEKSARGLYCYPLKYTSQQDQE